MLLLQISSTLSNLTSQFLPHSIFLKSTSLLALFSFLLYSLSFYPISLAVPFWSPADTAFWIFTLCLSSCEIALKPTASETTSILFILYEKAHKHYKPKVVTENLLSLTSNLLLLLLYSSSQPVNPLSIQKAKPAPQESLVESSYTIFSLPPHSSNH